MLCDVQVLAETALVAHLAVYTVFEGADEGDELFVAGAE